MAVMDRIPCIRPGCRRTAPFDKFGPGVEIVCGKCWRHMVPARLKHRHKVLNRELRKAERRRDPDPVRANRIFDLHHANWEAIRKALLGDEMPAGLTAFLEESKL